MLVSALSCAVGQKIIFVQCAQKKSDLVIFTRVSHIIYLATPQYATLSSSLNNYLLIFCKMLTLRLTFAIFNWERIFQIPFFRNIKKKDVCRKITLRLTFASFWLERIKSLTIPHFPVRAVGLTLLIAILLAQLG